MFGTVWPGAEDVARPCRPTYSCTADLAAPGTLELEAGASVAKLGTATRQWTFPFLLKQTFASWLQLQVGSNGYTTVNGEPNVRYFDNVFFGPKLHLLDQSDLWPSVALTAQLSLPTFESAGYARHDHAFFVAHASKDLGPIHVDANLGLNVLALEDSPLKQGFGALAVSTSLGGPFGVALEGYEFSGAAPVATKDGGIRAAFTVTPRPWLVFDVGADAGFFPDTRRYSVFFGATVISVVLWR